MKYLSFDLEATGLAEDDYIIEFAMIPFDTETKRLEEGLTYSTLVQCPPFESLEHRLDPWVVSHNKDLIKQASKYGLSHESFRHEIEEYFSNTRVKKFFNTEKEPVVLFGKSMNSIDLPFLNRDLGWKFMRKYFHHRTHDLSSVAYNLIDMNLIPAKCASGSELMKYLGMGDVAHTALEDAKNTAIMYLQLLEKFGK